MKNSGYSGNISFLNIFSLGNQNSETSKAQSFNTTERLILLAKVDFGVYFYDNNLTLNPEAQSLIAQNKTNEFIEAYGTHYINGVRKENSIWIILTKSNSQLSSYQNSYSNTNVSINIPYRANGSFEITQETEIEKLLKTNEYAVSVEINGPPIGVDLIKGIQTILNGDEENKLSSIKNIITEATSNISSPTQSKISQYYYAPFTLKGLKGIYWNEKKQNQLIKINEKVTSIFNIKSQIEPLASFSGQSIISKEFENCVANYSKKRKRKAQLIEMYDQFKPSFQANKVLLDSFLVLLEKDYYSCSDIFCDNSICCKAGNYDATLSNILLESKENLNNLDSLIKIAALEAYEETTPECRKENFSLITIINSSINPYDLYKGDKYLGVIAGGSKISYKENPGTYTFKAIQRSGFLMYATENLRQAIIPEPCKEITLNVGFED